MAQAYPPPEEDKPFWHCFWPLSPPPPDHKEVRLLASAKVASEHGWDWHICLLGRETIIDVLGVSVPASFMRSGQPYHDLVGGALNRAFAAASLVYSPTIRLLSLGDEQFMSLGMFSDNELPKAYGVQITMPAPSRPNWDPTSLLTFAAHTEIPADAVGALSEATRGDIPRHYRFLALCRALELLIPADRQRSNWLERYEDEFRALEIDPKRFRNYVPQLRNRCAHGLVGQERAIFGVASSGVPTEVFNLLMKAVVDRLSELSGERIFSPERSEERERVGRGPAGRMGSYPGAGRGSWVTAGPSVAHRCTHRPPPWSSAAWRVIPVSGRARTGLTIRGHCGGACRRVRRLLFGGCGCGCGLSDDVSYP